eukprot:scaffold5104_cov123-Isochrysis_galbana.AAC.2
MHSGCFEAVLGLRAVAPRLCFVLKALWGLQPQLALLHRRRRGRRAWLGTARPRGAEEGWRPSRRLESAHVQDTAARCQSRHGSRCYTSTAPPAAKVKRTVHTHTRTRALALALCLHPLHVPPATLAASCQLPTGAGSASKLRAVDG